MRLKRSQEIVIDFIDGAKNDDYLKQIMKLNLVVKTDVTHMSRIAKNRITFFIINKEKANILVDKEIMILEQTVIIKSYAGRDKRILFSNVRPFIRDGKITDALLSVGIKLTRPIEPLRASTAIPGYEHLASYRQQSYVNENKIKELPGYIIIDHEDLDYHVFITSDSLSCYSCKQRGHKAAACPNRPETSAQPSDENLADSSVLDFETSQGFEMNVNEEFSSETQSRPTSKIENEKSLPSPPPLQSLRIRC